MKKLYYFPILLTILVSYNCISQTLKSPEEFLGYKVGADYKLADYETIKYFKHLADNSTLVVSRIGKTFRSAICSGNVS
jgi:hypothetical protein